MSLKEPWKDRVPDEIDDKIQRFVEEGSTGQVRLNVSQGNILTADLREHVRPNSGKKVAERK